MGQITLDKRFFRLVILLLLFLALSACLRGQADNFSNQPASPAISQEDLDRQYQASLKEILGPYWQTGQISGLKDQILALRAPSQYLDLHFNLVVAFELIEQGQADADQAKIEDGLSKLDQLKGQYPWLNEN